MKYQAIAAALIGGALLMGGPAGPAAAGQLSGVWSTQKGWHVRMHRCGGAWCGTILSARGSKDTHNPNPKLRNRPMKGVRLLWGLKKSGNGWRGKLYNPNDGKVYTGKIVTAGATLKLSGCVLGGLICKSQTWRRVR
ncbi:MAG TPA: DUF2147 domain-containing protein [Thermopetrobacter sp.]|nr:DUF2147 domain-containing protein [Thermopetrobacter sp.]